MLARGAGGGTPRKSTGGAAADGGAVADHEPEEGLRGLDPERPTLRARLY
ncbi:hypothetical protein GCM10020367_56170 [Streptomyces sannanensis]|uniref:Uncharacterized protein n=1 Tax=Streptomyces sannanensis TaxID=285536 RepID=A0ABP6SJG2_9ACTN